MRTLNLFLLFFFLFAVNSYSLPKCEGEDFMKWNNCYGTYTFAGGDKYVGEWKDGNQHGKGTFTDANGKSTSGRYENDKKVGRHIEINY